MKLLTKALLKKIPRLTTTIVEPDPMVWCKFVTKSGELTWYLIEADGEDAFFGWVEGVEVDKPEFGYFRLSDLKKFEGPLRVERDLHFEPRRLSSFENEPD